MSSLDGTTPEIYEEELASHYDQGRFVTLELPEQDVLLLLENWKRDFHDLPNYDSASQVVFELIGNARKVLQEMEENIKKKAEAEARKKEKAEARKKGVDKPLVKKPRKRQQPRKKATIPESAETTAEASVK